MAPMVEAFHASELAERVKYKPDGQYHKPATNLKDCALKELIQYDCQLNGPQSSRSSKVVCKPILRLFRQCAGGLTVETTAWEDRFDGSRSES